MDNDDEANERISEPSATAEWPLYAVQCPKLVTRYNIQLFEFFFECSLLVSKYSCSIRMTLDYTAVHLSSYRHERFHANDTKRHIDVYILGILEHETKSLDADFMSQ